LPVEAHYSELGEEGEGEERAEHEKGGAGKDRTQKGSHRWYSLVGAASG
jgi:hypothetical protein